MSSFQMFFELIVIGITIMLHELDLRCSCIIISLKFACFLQESWLQLPKIKTITIHIIQQPQCFCQKHSS